MSSVELTLNVQEKNVRASKSDGTQVVEEMAFDELRLATISIFEDWLNGSRITRRRELEVLGTHLYRGLFNKVGAFFEQALREAQDDKQRLCIRLNFERNAEKLSRLPWEYLYYPDTDFQRGFFLSTHVHLILSRYIPPAKRHQNLPSGESTLRILIVVSDPEAEDTGLGPVVAEPIIEAFQKLEERHAITFHRMEKPTIDSFSDILNQVKPHVLHFFGHGRYNRQEREAQIALLNEDGKGVAWLNDKRFTDCFTKANPVPRLVFLHLCESSTIDFNANFDRLAPELIRADIQAVVAMKYPIATKAATVFCRTFYNELAKGESVDAAVQEGRYRITTSDSKAYDSRVFGTPVLYMQSSEIIFQPPAETASISVKVLPNIGSEVNSTSGSPIKQVMEPKVGPTQTEPVVNIESNRNILPPSTTQQDEGIETPNPLGGIRNRERKVDSPRVVETIVAEARKTIKGMTDLSVGQKVQMYKKLNTISNELVGNQLDEIINILLGERVEQDDEFGHVIIDSMLDSLEQYHEQD